MMGVLIRVSEVLAKISEKIVYFQKKKVIVIFTRLMNTLEVR